MQMRHAPLLSLVLLSVVTVVACSTAAPGWTYAPAPSATPAQSGAANAGASGAASGAPSGGASGAPSGGASGAPSGGGSGSTAVVQISATGIKFDQSTLTGPAAGFTIHFDNKDDQIPHDVDILDSSGKKVVDNKDFPGPAAKDYPIPPLPAGTYKFECSIHPTQMFGTLTVQ